ncbi:hypothetical protein L345_13066, partial [Ophiophagus hannah]
MALCHACSLEPHDDLVMVSGFKAEGEREGEGGREGERERENL